MIPARNENLIAVLYKAKPNSPFEYEQAPKFSFRCRLSSAMERKSYRLTKAVEAQDATAFIYATNCPMGAEPGDRIEVMGRVWKIVSVGYYEDQARMVDSGAISTSSLYERMPKGFGIR